MLTNARRGSPDPRLRLEIVRQFKVWGLHKEMQT